MAIITGTDGNDNLIGTNGPDTIFYEADGSGGAATVLFARVDAGTTLTHADFVVYTG